MSNDNQFIYKDIYELVTPVGKYTVTDGKQLIPFSVIRNSFDVPYDTQSGEQIHTDDNYCIMLPVRNLQIGEVYTIQFSDGKWEFCDSDEHTVAFNTIIDDWAVGIGAYDPCDFQKEEQMIAYSKQKGFIENGFYKEPPYYDETNFAAYSVESLEKSNGFNFKIYDRKREFVRFEVAWIQIKEHNEDEYAGALGLWLC